MPLSNQEITLCYLSKQRDANQCTRLVSSSLHHVPMRYIPPVSLRGAPKGRRGNPLGCPESTTPLLHVPSALRGQGDCFVASKTPLLAMTTGRISLVFLVDAVPKVYEFMQTMHTFLRCIASLLLSGKPKESHFLPHNLASRCKLSYHEDNLMKVDVL